MKSGCFYIYFHPLQGQSWLCRGFDHLAQPIGQPTALPCDPSSIDLVEPEEESKWGFVSGCLTGLRYLHDSLPMSRESQIRALGKGHHQTR